MAEDRTTTTALDRAKLSNFLAATAHCSSPDTEDAIVALIGALAIEISRHPRAAAMLDMTTLSVLDMRPMVLAAAQRLLEERLAREVDTLLARRPL